MRVVVTGACGRLGSVVVKLLCAAGQEVQAVDLEEPRAAQKRLQEHEHTGSTAPAERIPVVQAAYRQVDLTDLGQVYGALAGASGVIHLGAIPSPMVHPPDVVFRNNVLAQFNIFEAAATLGIRRVVSASSVSALGFPWQHRWSEPDFVPIDESHPLVPQDAYGLSKSVGEQIADAYSRRGAGSAVSLRFSTILKEDAYAQFISRVRSDVGAHAHLLWSYVDLRDAARSCLLALNAPLEGHVPLFVTAADTTSDLPTDALLTRYFPKVPRRASAAHSPAPTERWSLIDNTRARDVLDYRPEHTWSEVLAGQSGRPDGTP